MYLSEIPKYRDTIIQQICKNEKIISLITPDDQPNMRAKDLVYKRIFPYDHIVEKTTEAGTYLCFDVDSPRIVNRAFVDFRIFFWIIVHDRHMESPRGLRTDLLSAEIEQMMNGSKDFGIGRVELIKWDRFNPAEGFHARSLVYKTTDFNRE